MVLRPLDEVPKMTNVLIRTAEMIFEAIVTVVSLVLASLVPAR